MVSNHIEEDMIAKEIGMQTYLITDHIIGGINEDENVDQLGEYTDFIKYVRGLLRIS